MARWIQHPETGELIPADEYRPPEVNQSAYIQPDIADFISPVDRQLIGSRSHLREHNKRHGVTDLREYGDTFFQRKARERAVAHESSDSRARAERRQAIAAAMQQKGLY